MIKDYNNLDMSKPLSINDNLKKSKLVTSGSSILGAIIFFITYAFTKNVWMLSLAVILFISGIGYIFLINNIQEKYSKILDNNPKKEI